MSDKDRSLEKAWEKRADNFQEIDPRLPQGEKESEHFKSGLPPAPPKLDGVKKLKKQPSALDRKENRDKQRKFYQDNRTDQIQRKREERRNAPKKANITAFLIDLGVRPRSVVALSRMLKASPTWMEVNEPFSTTKVASALESFKTTLCNDMAKISGVKVAKGKEAEAPEEGDERRLDIKKVEDVSDEATKEASIRQDEWQLAQDTTKMGYAIAKSLGATNAQAMAAGMFAFTQIPDSKAVNAAVFEATYWSE